MVMLANWILEILLAGDLDLIEKVNGVHWEKT
jgi:hypothetical protein